MIEEKDNESSNVLLGLLNYHQKHFTYQREVLDRWFRFYLIIVAATLATLATLIKVNFINLNILSQRLFLGFGCILLSCLGFTFFFLNTAQRAICVNFVRQKMNPLEFVLWNMCNDLKPIASNGFNPNRFGADFAVGLVIAIVNTVWVVGSLFFLLELINRELNLGILILLLILVPSVQMIFRYFYLDKVENIRNQPNHRFQPTAFGQRCPVRWQGGITMNNEVDKKWPIVDDRVNTSLLSTIFAHYMHQNTLMYSRTNIVLALQGAGFAAGWAGGCLWGCVALLATGVITICLKQIIERDRQCRDANLNLMKLLEDHLLPGDNWIAEGAIAEGAFPRKIRVGIPPVKEWKAAGYLYRNIISILIVIDFAIAIATFFGLFKKITFLVY